MERLLWNVVVLFCLMFSRSCSSAKKVLFMPYPIRSHSHTHAIMARALVDLGHEAWLVLPDYIVNKGVLNTKGLFVMKYHTNSSLEDVIINASLKPFWEGRSPSTSMTQKQFFAVSDEILSDKALFREMKSVGADLFVFDDCLDISKMFVVFPYRLGIPFVGVDYTSQFLSRRIAFSPAVVPAFLANLSQRMTLIERLINTLNVLVELAYCPWYMEDAVARYAPEMPYVSLDRLVARAEVWLIQSDPILHMPYPALPNTKYIGGISAFTPNSPLSSTFQSFMDSAKNGVIVVSFGSMVETVPRNILDKLVAAFHKLRPYKVVFRVDAESPDPEYIMTSPWLPQNSLLAHRNCRVFVTHCGKNGLYQGLYHAVPMLGLPLFFDQFHNAHVMQVKGIGIRMDIRQVSAQDLVDAVRRLLQDARYKSAITRASRIYREQYGSPAKAAAYWLDHVMQYGGDYMRSAAQEMPAYQFLLLDVLGILAGAVGVAVAMVCVCVRRCKRRFRKVKEE